MSSELYFQWYEEMNERKENGEPTEAWQDWRANYESAIYDQLKDRNL